MTLYDIWWLNSVDIRSRFWLIYTRMQARAQTNIFATRTHVYMYVLPYKCDISNSCFSMGNPLFHQGRRYSNQCQSDSRTYIQTQRLMGIIRQYILENNHDIATHLSMCISVVCVYIYIDALILSRGIWSRPNESCHIKASIMDAPPRLLTIHMPSS